jgi:hypothetical protein
VNTELCRGIVFRLVAVPYGAIDFDPHNGITNTPIQPIEDMYALRQSDSVIPVEEGSWL